MKTTIILPVDAVQNILREIDLLLKYNDNWLVHNIDINYIDSKYSCVIKYEELDKTKGGK